MKTKLLEAIRTKLAGHKTQAFPMLEVSVEEMPESQLYQLNQYELTIRWKIKVFAVPEELEQSKMSICRQICDALYYDLLGKLYDFEWVCKTVTLRRR